MKTLITIFLIWSLSVSAFAAGASQKDDADKLYQKGYQLVLDKNWSEAAKTFEQLVNTYRKSSWVDDARFWLCFSKEKLNNDAGAAFDCYNDFIKSYPESQWSDDALQNMARLASELEKAGKSEYTVRLHEIENNMNDEVTLAALQALQARGDNKAFESIVKVFGTTKNADIRRKMVYMIGSFDNPKAREKLKDIATNDKNEDIRGQALFWLAQNNEDAETAKFLADRIAQETNTDVQRKALTALAQMPGKYGTDQLFTVAESNPNDETRAMAIFWASQNNPDENSIIKIASFARKDKSSHVQEKALFALSEIESEKSLDELIKLSKELPKPELRQKALFWISQNSSSEKAVNAIKSAAKSDPDPEVRRKAIFAISQFPESLAKPNLMEIAKNNSDPAIRSEAIFWLAQNSEDKDVIDFIKKTAFDDKNQNVQEKAVFGLSQLNNNKGVDALIEIAQKHPNLNIRKKAIFWLGQSDDVRAAKALEDILYNNN